MNARDVYELTKEIVSDVKNLGDKKLAVEILEKLMDLQEKLIELNEQETCYKDEIKDLEKQIENLTSVKNIKWLQSGIGVVIDDNGVEHHYCQHCYSKTGKLYEIPRMSEGGRCPECKNYFYF